MRWADGVLLGGEKVHCRPSGWSASLATARLSKFHGSGGHHRLHDKVAANELVERLMPMSPGAPSLRRLLGEQPVWQS